MASDPIDVGGVTGRIEKAVMGAIFRTCTKIQSHASDAIMNPPKTGRIYHRRGNVFHQASAPGEAPASEHGAAGLAGHITVELDPATLSGTVTARRLYASYLEFGTRNMEPRPFMRPALEANRQDFFDDVSASIERALAGSA